MAKKTNVETIKGVQLLSSMPEFKSIGNSGISDDSGDKLKSASDSVKSSRDVLKDAINQLNKSMNEMADAFKDMDKQVSTKIEDREAGTTAGNKYSHLPS